LGGHPIHLRIRNASNICPDPDGRAVTIEEAFWARMDRIVSIDLSINPEHAAAAADRQVDAASLECIFQICGESRAIDMNGLRIADACQLFFVISVHCQRLQLLTWNNSDGNVMPFGNDFSHFNIVTFVI
jgi:hypothetical protein